MVAQEASAKAVDVCLPTYEEDGQSPPSTRFPIPSPRGWREVSGLKGIIEVSLPWLAVCQGKDVLLGCLLQKGSRNRSKLSLGKRKKKESGQSTRGGLERDI